MLIKKQTVYIKLPGDQREEGLLLPGESTLEPLTPVTPLAPCFPHQYKEDKWKSAILSNYWDIE